MVYDWTWTPLSVCFDVTGKENGLFESDFLTPTQLFRFNSYSFKHGPVHLNILYYLMCYIYLGRGSRTLIFLKIQVSDKNNFPEIDSLLRMKKQ